MEWKAEAVSQQLKNKPPLVPSSRRNPVDRNTAVLEYMFCTQLAFPFPYGEDRCAVLQNAPAHHKVRELGGERRARMGAVVQSLN